MKIVLASASPRRRQLLEELGIKNFRILPSEHEEPAPAGASPEDTVAAIAMAKAADTASRCGADELVIAADTLVFLDGKPLGKPHSEEEAKEALRSLSGREHTVITGIALILGEKRLSASEVTKVRFRTMTEEEICWYVSTGEPMDKAGSYGIQGRGSMFIEGIDGDFFNVMGLPVCRLIGELKNIGIGIADLIG